MMPMPRPKKRRRKGKQYFTKEHENAIIQYVASNDLRERSRLYNEYIGPVFSEMVDKIVYTYKFAESLIPIKYLKVMHASKMCIESEHLIG